MILILFMSCATRSVKSEFGFANMMAKNELWKEAQLRWEKLIPKMDKSAKLYNNLAIAYEIQGEFKKAESAYKTALKLAPKNSYIKDNYDRFLGKKKRKPAKKKGPGSKDMRKRGKSDEN